MGTKPARKHLVVTLSLETYRKLAEIAASEERLEEQQAAIILRDALEVSPPQDEREGSRQ